MEPYFEKLRLTGVAGLDFLIALVVCAVAAKVVDLFFDRFLRRLAARTRMELDDAVLDIVHTPIQFGVFFMGAAQALRLLPLDPRLGGTMAAALHTVVIFFAAVAVGRLSALFIDAYFRKTSDSSGLGKDLQPLFNNVARVAIVVAMAMAVFSVWKVDITPLLASAGIVGVAVALAAKDTLANLFGGISIFIDRPYKIGDYIVMDDGQRGEVVAIGIRSSRIKTRDDILISVPNSIMANTRIINQSAPFPAFRVRVPVGVGYDSDVEKVEEVLMAVARAEEMVLKDPAPRVRFRRFGDSALEFELLFWCSEPAMKGRSVHRVNKAIVKAFRAEGISIPYPQRDVHVTTGLHADDRP